MADFVRVPEADWQDICDSVREKTGGEDGLLSSEVAPAVRGIQSGQEVFYNSAGQFYVKELNTPLVGIATERLYAINGVEVIYGPEITGCGHYAFGAAWCALRKLILPKFVGSGAFGCNGNQHLEEVQLGSIGHPVENLSDRFFNNSGANSNPTITIYVDASALADIVADVIGNSPFSCANATIIYRNSTTGEVITE